MARQTFEELQAQEVIELANKYLVVDTEREGFNGRIGHIYKGTHPYRVIQEGEDYKVYPTQWKDGTSFTLVNEKYPIIVSAGDDVFYTTRTIHDPYNYAYTKKVTQENKSVEHKILDAFNAYSLSEYRFGEGVPYQSVLLVDDASFTAVEVEDGEGQNGQEVTFERLDVNEAQYRDPTEMPTIEGSGEEGLAQ